MTTEQSMHVKQTESAWSTDKALGDEAYRSGRYEEARAHYTNALEAEPSQVPLLLNRSLTALQLGKADLALSDATTATQLLAAAGSAANPVQLSKAYFRTGAAQLAQGRAEKALACYRRCFKLSGEDSALMRALSDAAAAMPLSWLAQQWAGLVEDAQQPNPLSSRDGKLLRPVPAERRLGREKLARHAEAALQRRERVAAEARRLLCQAWARGKQPGRAEVAFLRAHAYLQAGNPEQALKDARVALAYGPRRGECSAWAHAHAAQAAALEAAQAWLPAAQAMQHAAEQDTAEPLWRQERDRLLLHISEEAAAALQEGGSAGLDRWLEAQREAALPEFKRRRPKYHYYYEDARKRIAQHCGALPEPVLDKLLNIEAGELDTLLTYPAGIQAKAELAVFVLEERGEQYLETWRVPQLTWTELQELKAQHAQTPAIEGGAAADTAMLEHGKEPAPEGVGESPSSWQPSAALGKELHTVHEQNEEVEDLDAID